MNLVDHYIETLTGKKQEWAAALVHFMRDADPSITESFINNMPTYQGEGYDIAFAARSNYFSFYTSDERVYSLIQELSPTAIIGKKGARLKYSDPYAINNLIDVMKEIIDYNHAQKSHKVVDLTALKKWNAIPPESQQRIVQNVYCSTCSVTTIVNYTLQNDRVGFVLKGKCGTCGGEVARFVEEG